ncbi:MAG: hypothetical protein BMS9Abin12_0874 [Acidimicrobiia bacterium]|nr:MAG: hypothetical protein BMS9Abin12_0874 [Acidimicrobiia bacterium]
MNPGPLSYVLVSAFGIGAVVSGWLVFRTDSMLRAAYWLMVSFVSVGAMLVVLDAQFLGLILILMMSGEMTIMAIFMIMFMMNPAGLNPMTMVHQHRTSIIAGVGSFLVLAWVGVMAEFPNLPATTADPTVDLGEELLGRSMLIFESAGVALLAVMIGAIALVAKQGRFGDAYDGSQEPDIEVGTGSRT